VLVVRWQSSRLAMQFSTSMLAAGGGGLDNFRAAMESWPAGNPGLTGDLQAATSLGQAVSLMTTSSVASALSVTSEVPKSMMNAYRDAYANDLFRQNVLKAVQIARSNATVGLSSNGWISISILRDVVPWSGQIIYQLLGQINGLVAGAAGAAKEITAFADMLTSKINALETFVKSMTGILDFIETLEISFSMLLVPSISGGAPEWVSAVQNAGGDKPAMDPSHYTGGVFMAYAGPNIDAIQKAFALIF